MSKRKKVAKSKPPELSVGYRDGQFWDAAGTPWRRVDEWMKLDEVRSLMATKVPWVIDWCGGRLEVPTSPVDKPDEYVLRKMVDKPKRPSRTVVVVEHWRNDREQSLLIFVEGPSAARADSWFY